MKEYLARASAAAALGAALLATPSAQAANQLCTDLATANPGKVVYIVAGDTQMNMLRDLARKLRDAEDPLFLIFLPAPTCDLATNIYNKAPLMGAYNVGRGMPQYMPSQAELSDSALASATKQYLQCDLPADGTSTVKSQLNIGATFISSCATLPAQPDDIGRAYGPAQAYGFIVPEGQLTAANSGMTWLEAYYVFSGQGASLSVAPWTAADGFMSTSATTGTGAHLNLRGNTASTLLTMAANVGLKAASWLGVRWASSDALITNVVGASSGEAPSTIGILGMDLYDNKRASLDMLAFQAKGQKYGYFPDSKASSMDKRNVRDGHYVPWSYTEYLYYKDANGGFADTNVERLMKIIFGNEEVRLKSAAGVTNAFDLDSMSITTKRGLIPHCAMSVSRESDGGELSLYSSDAPCGCFFESVQDPTVTSSDSWKAECPSCTTNSDCGTGACRRGYCEAK